jgi:hypothetical protein
MSYVHGYDESESRRLADQASTLVELLHHDTHYHVGTTKPRSANHVDRHFR